MNNLNHLFKNKKINLLKNNQYTTLKELGISLLWFLFWIIVYGICVFIYPELVFVPMLLNLPLASFFCLGIILQFISILVFQYSESYDILVKIIVFILTFISNFTYRQILFKDSPYWKKRLKFRFIEFWIWLIPWLIIVIFLGGIVRLTQ